jgi:PAS domain S-box-containing protein
LTNLGHKSTLVGIPIVFPGFALAKPLEVSMVEAIRRLLGLPFMPHGMCYLWDPRVVWLHVVSDTFIALAYLAIPIALIYFVRRRRDLPFHWIFVCFGVFIVACGMTHVMEVWNVWHANYLVAAGIKAATAFASVPTAFLLVRLIPRALAIPSPAQLRRSEERFRMAAKSGRMFAFEWNAATDLVTISGEFAAILGMKEGESMSGKQALAQVHPDDRESLATAVARLSPKNPDSQITHRMILSDQSTTWVESSSHAYFDDSGRIARVVGMVADIAERKAIEMELSELSHQLIRSQETERRNVAQDLHESAGQTLAALKMALTNLAHSMENEGGPNGEQLNAAQDLAAEAIREVRVISYLMYPPLLDDAGLRPALHWYVRGFSERSGIEAKLEMEEGWGRDSRETETAVFRVVQEALTNVYRHSGSRTAVVRLARDTRQIRVEIQDQGRGMILRSNPHEENLVFGVGIAGIRERAKQLHGTFQIESASGCGTTVRVTLPLPKAQHCAP